MSSQALIIVDFIFCLVSILCCQMVCVNLIKCAFSTDSQAAAGQAAGPGSPRGRRLSRKDSGDQAGVRAAIVIFPSLFPCWPSTPDHLLSAVSYLFNRLFFVSVVTSWACQTHSQMLVTRRVFILPSGSSRTKRLWVRSCRTLSLTQRSVIDRGLPGALQPPRHVTRQRRWQKIDPALLQLPQPHLLIPPWPPRLTAAVLFHPEGFSHSGSVSSVVLCLCLWLQVEKICLCCEDM